MANIFKKKNKNTSDYLISLSYTKWKCKYYIIFKPKYKRKIFCGEKRREIGKILREFCDWNEVKIIEAEIWPDHIHMFMAIPLKLSVLKFIGILKGKSSFIIFQRWSNLKYKFYQQFFWFKVYYVDMVGKNEKKIA